MKRLSLIAVAASLAINAGALGVIAFGIDESSLPQGQVVITELGGDSQSPIYAQADGDVANRGAVVL
jgi:hypothetical protein